LRVSRWRERRDTLPKLLEASLDLLPLCLKLREATLLSSDLIREWIVTVARGGVTS
jgi:hypothetical protein